MVEQNYTSLHDIVGFLLRASFHRDKICPGQLELRATVQGSGSKRLRPVLTLRERDPERSPRPAGPPEAVSPHVAHGDLRSRDATLRSPWLPAAANGAESCTLGRVVSGDGGPATAGRLAPCCLLGGAPQPWQPARRPLRRGEKSWITPAARIQLASLGQHAPGGKPRCWRAAPATRSGPLTDAHGEEGRCEQGGNLLCLTKHLHCFFEPPGQASALSLRKNFSLLST